MRPGPFDDWQDRTLDQTMRACAVLVGVAFLVVMALDFCGCDRSAAARAKLAVDSAAYTKALDDCIALGKDAGSFDVYDRCAQQADKDFGRVSK